MKVVFRKGWIARRFEKAAKVVASWPEAQRRASGLVGKTRKNR